MSGDVVDEETGETLPMGADGESSADVVRTRTGVTDDARLATESPGLPKIGGPRVHAGATR